MSSKELYQDEIREQELTQLLLDIPVLTKIEDVVVRKGEPKSLARSLLFFAAQDVGQARYIENGRVIQLYDLPGSKPCELTESQTALSKFAQKYNSPEGANDFDAIEAIAELSDVFYNLAQLINIDAFRSIAATFRENNLFIHLLEVAKIKYLYRYVDRNVSNPRELVEINLTDHAEQLLSERRPERKKDIDFETKNLFPPLFAEFDPGYPVDLLVYNWDLISSTLHSLYSNSRSVAKRLDLQTAEALQKTHLNPDDFRDNYLINQMVIALNEMPTLTIIPK